MMLDGRRKSEWSQTSLIACLLAEPNRDTRKRSKPFEPDDFNPTVETLSLTPDELNAERQRFFKGM